MKKILSLLSVVGLMGAATASAQTLYNTDFAGTTTQYTGVGVLTGPTQAGGTTFWGGYDTRPGSFASPSSTPYTLADSADDAGSTVTLSLSSNYGAFTEGTATGGETAFTNPVHGDAIYNNFYYLTGAATTPSTMTLTGLAPSTFYNIVVYGDNQNGESAIKTAGVYTTGLITTAQVDLSETAATPSTGFATFTSTLNGTVGGVANYVGNYIEVQGESTAAGGLVVDLVNVSGGEAISGLSIQAVPEPSLLAMLLVGLPVLGFFAFRRLQVQA